MTAQPITRAASPARPADRRLAGLGALVRKDTTEWIRGRRAWVIALITTGFMALTAANGWITSQLASLPGAPDIPPVSLDPLENLLAAVGAQVWVLAAIFAVGSLIVAERQTGTLSWVASKPVSRTAIWASKWASSVAMLTLAAVVVPMAVTVGTVAALYGLPSPAMVAGLVLGMIAVIAFFAAAGLAFGTILPGQPAVIAAGFAVFAALPMLAAIVPFDVTPYLPTTILQWIPMAIAGEPVPTATPIAYAIATVAGAWFGINRMNRMEL